MKVTDREIQRRPSKVKNVVISMRITKDISEWLSENNLSPTGIFYKALKELGCPGVE